VHCGEILNTVIINYETLWNKSLVRTREMFGGFQEFCNFEKFKTEVRKKLNICLILAKICD